MAEGIIEINFESETGFPSIDFIPKEDKLNFETNDERLEKNENGYHIDGAL